MNDQVFPSESDRIDLFLSLIAHPWGDHCSKEVEEDYMESLSMEKHCWAKLKTLRHRFQEDFGVLNEKAKATTDLEKLRMEDGKLDSYITSFETIAPRTKFNDEAL